MCKTPQFCPLSSTLLCAAAACCVCTHINWGHRESSFTEVYKVCKVRHQAFLIFIALRCQYFPLVSTGFCWCSSWHLLRMDLLLHTKRLCHEVLIHSPIFNTPSDCHLLCFFCKTRPKFCLLRFFVLWTFHSMNGSTATRILSFFQALSALWVLDSHCPVVFYTFCPVTVHKYNCKQKISFYKWKTVTEWESSCEAITLNLCPNQTATSVFS